MKRVFCWFQLLTLILIGGLSLALSLLAIADGRYDWDFFFLDVGTVVFMTWSINSTLQEMKEIQEYSRR